MNEYTDFDGLEDYSWDETVVTPDGAVFTIRWGDDEVPLDDPADAGDGGLALCSTVERRVGFLEQMGYLTPEVDGQRVVTRAGCEAVAEVLVDRMRGAA